MRNYLKLMFIITLTSTFILSCEDEKDIIQSEGKIEFNAVIIDNESKSLKIKSDDLREIISAIITIENKNGETIIESKEINFYKFESSYITAPLPLTTGSYVLTKFYLIDNSGTVIYASPLESSELSYLVDQALPIVFTIDKDEVTTLYPEVLSTYGYEPEDFGYISFGINNVETFDFLLTAFNYNSVLETFELTEADIVVSSGRDTLYLNSIEAVTNKITIKDGYDNYNISINKLGYNSYYKTFTNDSLKDYYGNPLTIILDSLSINDGLLSYFQFNGNTKDSGVNANHGFNHGAMLAIDRFGNLNSAYSFDGLSSYMELSKDINTLNGLTFAFWINSRGAQTGENNGIVISKYHAVKDTRNFNIGSFGAYNDNTTNRIHILFFKYGYSTSYHDAVYSDWTAETLPVSYDAELWNFHNPMCIPLSAWKFVVINLTETELQVWIDGVLTVSKEREFSTYANSIEKVLIGNSLSMGDGENNHFNGILDDIRIYNRPLTWDEIKALYHEGGWDE